MELKIADVVVSLNGRDEGKDFIIIQTDDMYSLLVDGKTRKLEKPKKKKNKHLRRDGVIKTELAAKLNTGEKTTNKEIRKALAEYNVTTKGDDE